ncbi:MAG: tetratricopeptide (TPR) repeat protein [Candidatus Azotimanducaceae bacterium]|jgi:tetratricopeptide (TPR) repeat protein
MLAVLNRFLSLLIIYLICSTAVAASIEEMMLTGNHLRLTGNMEAANQIKDQIRQLAPGDPASYAFNLNTIITELSWEESQRRFDEQLISDAKQLIALCEAGAVSASSTNNPDYYCGQAHFALSFYNGLRGNYIRAGRNGTTAIDYLESALKQDPDLIRAKMYLGIAYYYADNLPHFIKLFSKVLWFIPSGNSAKSLPYLRDVMASDDAFSDVARYIYATLLLNGSDAQIIEALSEIDILIARYPENARFQLRYVSVILWYEEFLATLDRINAYMATEHGKNLSVIDTNLLNIWAARAHLGLGQVEQAIRVQRQIKFDPINTTVPSWGLAWHELTRGQLEDLTGNRKAAIESYERILALDDSTFVNPTIVAMARASLSNPYTLPSKLPAPSLKQE